MATTTTVKEVAGGEAETQKGTAPPRELTLTCGAYSAPQSIVDMKVAEVRKFFAEIANISAEAGALVSGKRVKEDYQLQPEDRELEFRKPSGRNG